MSAQSEEVQLPDPRMRWRVWIAGELVSTTWIDTTDADAADQVDKLRKLHQRMCLSSGLPWMVELYDPAEPEVSAFLRFGTDDSLMQMPLPANLNGALDHG